MEHTGYNILYNLIIPFIDHTQFLQIISSSLKYSKFRLRFYVKSIQLIGKSIPGKCIVNNILVLASFKNRKYIFFFKVWGLLYINQAFVNIIWQVPISLKIKNISMPFIFLSTILNSKLIQIYTVCFSLFETLFPKRCMPTKLNFLNQATVKFNFEIYHYCPMLCNHIAGYNSDCIKLNRLIKYAME